jgi:hypothetical protein
MQEDDCPSEVKMMSQLYHAIYSHPYHPQNQVAGKSIRDDAKPEEDW